MTQHEPNHIPDDALEALARRLLPEIRSFFESEEGQREYAEWSAQQGTKIKPHGKTKTDEKLSPAG